MKLKSVEIAKRELLSQFSVLDKISIPIASARNHVLASDVESGVDHPPFSNSAMDGFAVNSSDIQSASFQSPAVLPIIADVKAGDSPGTQLGPGEIVRIMTGAPLPEGADAVIPIEDTDHFNPDVIKTLTDQVKVHRSLKPGEYVRKKGANMSVGELIFTNGKSIQPVDIGMFAMLGLAAVEVYRKPFVGLISSGDELSPVGSPLEPGKIYDSNSPMLKSLIEHAGGIPIKLGVCPDDYESVKTCLDDAVDKKVDLILSSAGVSVGDYDFVRKVVEDHGELGFWRVNMRPGKPLVFGHYRSIPFIGLPGNPVSSYFGFEVFVRPAILKMCGHINTERQHIDVSMMQPVHSDGRESYLRANIELTEDGIYQAHLMPQQGSGNLKSLVQANGVVIVPAGNEKISVGSSLKGWLFERS